MKKFLSAFLAVAMILSLAACGKKDVEEPPQQDIPTPPVTDLPDVSMPVISGDEDRVAVDTVEDEPIVDDIGPEELESEPGSGDSSEGSSEGSESEDGKVGDIFGGSSGGEEDEESEEEVPDEEAIKRLNPADGEKAIASGKFDGGVAAEDSIREMLHVNGAQVSSEVITATMTILNSYSKEGFLRFIEEASTRDTNTQSAAVLVCKMLGIKYETLWENGFMEEVMVETIVEVLDNAEKEWKEGGKK